MSIRVKTLIIIVVTGFISILFLYLFLSRSVINTYLTLETKDAQANVGRVTEALGAEITSLNSKTGDWANWDDSYNFIQGKGGNDFIEVNYYEPTFEQLKVNAIIFIDNDGKLFYAREYDLKNKVFVELNKNWGNVFSQSIILQKDMDKSLGGIVMLDSKPMMIAAKPILTSQAEGPIAGTLIMARYLDSDMVEYLSKIVKSPLEIQNFSNNTWGITTGNNIVIKAVDNNNLQGYALINDVFSKPSIILRETLTRDIYNYGLQSLRSFLITLSISGSIFVLVIFILIEFNLLSRLMRLSKQVVNIGAERNLSLRVGSYGSDEIGYLATNINTTLDDLEKLTEKVAFESSQRKSILETMGEGVVVTDSKKQIIYINPAFENLLGYSTKDLTGKVFNTTFSAYDLHEKPLPKDFLEDEKAQIAKGSQVKVLLEGKKEKRAAIINTSPIIVSGKKLGVVRVFHDYSAELELTRQKDDFFSIASHELRTPLTIISGNLDNIIQGFGGSKLTETDNKLMNDTVLSSDRLTSMINDFLNVSRLDQGRVKLEIKPVSACNLTEKIISEMTPLFNEKGIELKFICDKKHSKVLADEDRLRQVIVNLVGNSLKFTGQGSVTITHKVSGNMLITDVTDTGMGIPKDKQRLLFHRFQQAMSRTLTRQPGGTGLGLYISKEFVKLMGGDMKLANSNLGKGSTFSFTIPLEKYTINTSEDYSKKIYN
jgi:PAS domain S-box-containing protein